jgi:hypothetical protein
MEIKRHLTEPAPLPGQPAGSKALRDCRPLFRKKRINGPAGKLAGIRPIPGEFPLRRSTFQTSYLLPISFHLAKTAATREQSCCVDASASWLGYAGVGLR